MRIKTVYKDNGMEDQAKISLKETKNGRLRKVQQPEENSKGVRKDCQGERQNWGASFF